MHYLLFIGAFLFFAFIAPPKVTILTCGLLIISALVVKVAAQTVANTSPSLGESFKSVGLSFAFLAIALFTLTSFSRGTGVSQFAGLSAVAVLGALLGSYVLGFKIALGTSFGASAVIALISTTVSGLLLWVAKGVL